MCDTNNNESCFACRLPALNLIECNELSSQMVARDFCTSCIVGKEVPVYRQSLNIWSFGVVKSFNEFNSTHAVEFLSGDTEIVSIDRNPFQSYLSHDEEGIRKNVKSRQVTNEYPETPSPEARDSSLCNIDQNNILDFTFNLPDPTPVQQIIEQSVQNDEWDPIQPSQDPYSFQTSPPNTIPFDSGECSLSDLSDFSERRPSVELLPGDSCWDHMASSLRDLVDEDNMEHSEAHDLAEVPNYSHIVDVREPMIIDTRCLQENPYRNDSQKSPGTTTNTVKDSHASNYITAQNIQRKIRHISMDESSSFSKETEQDKSTNNKKSRPRMWTPEEDSILLDVVKNLPHPIKWPSVAKSLPKRTSKQCRERFLNQLNPNLKNSEWSCLEDAIIFNLYSLFGAQWAKISSLIFGRTDNSVKNRFHHIRRRMEKDCSHSVKKQKPSCRLGRELQTTLDQMHVDSSRESTCFQKKVTKSIGFSVAKSLMKESNDVCTVPGQGDTSDRFRKAKNTGEQCKRCCLFLPSKHCGTRVCKFTGWCETCTQIPSYVSRDCLYDSMWLHNKTLSQES